MITLAGERHGQMLSGTNVDVVITAFDLPKNSVLTKINCKVDLVSKSLAIEREEAIMYAAAAYLIELDDPDTGDTYDDIWDRFVPKWTDTDAIDFDTAGVAAAPFWEPGEADFESFFDMGDIPQRLYMKRRMLNFADPGSGGIRFQPSETPFEPQWIAGDSFTFKLNKQIRIRKPSVMILALASPGLGDTTTARVHLTEFEWGDIQYVEQTLERALMHQQGKFEAGAETPYEEASAVLRKHLAPDVFEQTAATFITEQMVGYFYMQFEHTVPGTMDFTRVDITK